MPDYDLEEVERRGQRSHKGTAPLMRLRRWWRIRKQRQADD
jgi:hypothetical protein